MTFYCFLALRFEMFRFSPICTLANLFNRGSVESLKSFMPSSFPRIIWRQRNTGQRGGLPVGWEKKAPGNQLSHSLQVLGHGFVLATITKQQTTSVGKGHKKFSFPLLKPSGAYKKNPTGWLGWLVAPPPRSALLGTFREFGGTRRCHRRNRGASGRSPRFASLPLRRRCPSIHLISILLI